MPINFFLTKLNEKVKIASDRNNLKQMTCISAEKIWDLTLWRTSRQKTKR